MTYRSIAAALALALLAGCTAQHALPPIVTSGDGAGILRTEATHKATFKVTDVTDPQHPQLVYYKEGNLVGECGIRALMGAFLMQTDLGSATGAANTLGQLCQGANQALETKRPNNGTTDGWTNGMASIGIGAASTSTCTGAGSPWACCTGNGTGCTVSNYDVISFTEGQPNGSNVNVAANWLSFLNAGGTDQQGSSGNNFALGQTSSFALYWNTPASEGLTATATFGPSFANQQWCEYVIRGTNVYTGLGPFSVTYSAATHRPGWQLAHGVISPCITKSSGQTFIVTWTLSVS